MSRKRHRDDHDAVSDPKRRKLADPETRVAAPKSSRVHQPLLSHVYDEVEPLRDRLLSLLPAASRIRRRRLQSIEQQNTVLSDFLTSTLVCTLQSKASKLKIGWQKDFEHFTQTQKTSQDRTASAQYHNVREIIDFVIWYLFQKCSCQTQKPDHVLCHGLERTVTVSINDNEQRTVYLPGIIRRRDSTSSEAFRLPVWEDVVKLLGRDGRATMIEILVNDSVFMSIGEDTGNYTQISGTPINEVMLSRKTSLIKPTPHAKGRQSVVQRLDSIVLARSRILYGKPSFNSAGKVQFGLKSSHVLRRVDNLEAKQRIAILMRYIFPRQFGLHNVFTFKLDRNETSHAFRDYTYREKDPAWNLRKSIPRRLRGRASQLLQKLIRNHVRCSYHQLLSHCCPIRAGKGRSRMVSGERTSTEAFAAHANISRLRTQLDPMSTLTILNGTSDDQVEEECSSFLPYAMDSIQVTAFCSAVLQQILPSDVLGSGPDGDWNWKIFLANVRRFVCMRQRESISLHQIVQHLKLRSIQWLIPEKVQANAKVASSDKIKREELLHELLYFIFDSLLIPIINSNFYVTESGVHRNKLIFFRYDVWSQLCRPCLRAIKLNSYVPIDPKIRNVTLGPRLGHSHLRLLPKDVGVRRIVNLGYRNHSIINGRPVLRQSINAQLAPVFNIFKFEQQGNKFTFRTGSLSYRDLQTKLLDFKSRLAGPQKQAFYFMKVDIRSAFDSIPQDQLINLVGRIFKRRQYNIITTFEGKVFGPREALSTSGRYVKSATSVGSQLPPAALSKASSSHRKNIVYAGTDQSRLVLQSEARQLLEEHVHNNIVKIDKNFYRQSVGIAQGSILSSLLCTFFYNHFEERRLGFLNSSSSTLLRMMDDFLLITTSREEAQQFVTAMAEGDASYGIRLHPEKSLANFDVASGDIQVPKTPSRAAFPFCGLFIDTETLQVSKNRERKDNDIVNTLTIDLHGKAGQKFRKRIESAMRTQLKGIFLNPLLNDKMRILRTLIECFQETAMKMHQYHRHLPRGKQPSPIVLIKTIQQLISLVLGMIHQFADQSRITFGRPQVSLIAVVGIHRVLSAKRSQYTVLIDWLQMIKRQFGHSLNLGASRLEAESDLAFQSLRHYRY